MDTSPLRDLRLRTPRLELRLGTRDELVELGRLAEGGIHPPETMPFSVPWTDGVGEPGFLVDFVAYHEGKLDEWSPEAWALGLLIWKDGQLVGTQELFSTEFTRRRGVGTGSWLGQAFHGRGIGTEMRAAMLELAFHGLGAAYAESSWLEGNEASRRVSEKLGYRDDVVNELSPRGTPVMQYGVRIDRTDWRCPFNLVIEALEPSTPLRRCLGTSPRRGERSLATEREKAVSRLRQDARASATASRRSRIASASAPRSSRRGSSASVSSPKTRSKSGVTR